VLEVWHARNYSLDVMRIEKKEIESVLEVWHARNYSLDVRRIDKKKI